MTSLNDLSIIIPIGPGEDKWVHLLEDLELARTRAEIILALTDEHATHGNKLKEGVRCTFSSPGRAIQMNTGAAAATRTFVWFIHADTRISQDSIARLLISLEADPCALHFLDLHFDSDAGGRTVLNDWGVRLRSHLLKLPFGDQALCLDRNVFNRLGQFNEHAQYGEDHLLVWAAHRNSVSVVPVGSTITTSSRRYKENGWLKTTLRTAGLTWKQAAPEFLKLIRGIKT